MTPSLTTAAALELGGFECGRSRRQDQGERPAPQELTEEIQRRPPLLPARPPHRYQHGLGPRRCPGPAATPDLAQDDAEADGQFRPPVGGIQPRFTEGN